MNCRARRLRFTPPGADAVRVRTGTVGMLDIRPIQREGALQRSVPFGICKANLKCLFKSLILILRFPDF